MKAELHPNYTVATITCACGNVIETNSTKSDMKVDICSKCHPYWTGNLKRETTGGRADKFKKNMDYNKKEKIHYAKHSVFFVC